MQNQKLRTRHRRDRVGAAVVVAEFDQRSFVAEDSTTVPTWPRASLCAGTSYSSATTSSTDGPFLSARFASAITAPSR